MEKLSVYLQHWRLQWFGYVLRWPELESNKQTLSCRFLLISVIASFDSSERRPKSWKIHEVSGPSVGLQSAAISKKDLITIYL